MDKRRRGRKPKRDAPIDRFTWQDGDVIVTYDPSKDPDAKSSEEYHARRRAKGEIVESDLRQHPHGDVVRFKARRRVE